MKNLNTLNPPYPFTVETGGYFNALTSFYIKLIFLQLHLCRRVRLPNECPVYDTKHTDCETSVMMELWGMRSTSSFYITPRSTLARRGNTWKSIGQIELISVLMQNWIVYNRYLSTFKMCTHVNLNSLN